jgi:hypothetical protein
MLKFLVTFGCIELILYGLFVWLADAPMEEWGFWPKLLFIIFTISALRAAVED